MVIKLKILLNPDKEIVKEVRKQLIRTGGYCPYMLIRSPATLCMCEDFRAKIADPEFEGYCHCLMYYKQKQNFIHNKITIIGTAVIGFTAVPIFQAEKAQSSEVNLNLNVIIPFSNSALYLNPCISRADFTIESPIPLP